MPEPLSIVHIKDSVRDVGVDDIQEVPLAQQEEDDHLTPLMMDNHTVLEHQETFKSITRLIDVVDRVHEIPEFKPYQHSPQPTVRNCDKKDSIGSIDSDGSFERQNSIDDSPTHRHHLGYSSSSDENAKDSGCDVNADEKKDDNDEESAPIEIPDDELAEKIVTQVEFYFSNENILKDAFLLKHVRRNKEAFVSLKLISSFKRVRQLTKDWRVVGYAIKLKSVNIEVNDLGTKVRRLDPLPVFDETMPSRTVVATDLPIDDKITIEKVSDLFSKCGEIALIRILRPGGSIPADVRQFYNKHPELHERDCALVEFTESESARRALELEGMQTFEMVAPKKKTGKKATVSKIVENYKYQSYGDAERSRGGDGGYKYDGGIRRNSSGFYVKHDSPQHTCQHQHRKTSFTSTGGTENCDYFNRRSSNCSIGSATDITRKFSNCSEAYSSCSGSSSDASRRQSMCSIDSRRPSNCSADVPFRRLSNCSPEFCSCSRRPSQCASDGFRRTSQCSEHGRRFSNASTYERRMSAATVDSNGRRVSFDNEFADRKMSTGSFGSAFEHHRKISSGFDQIRKVSSGGDKFFDSRKMSNDSGYDRRCSISSVASDYAPRSRNNSVIAIPAVTAAAAKAEILVRTPIGPDGSKGFSSRARKVGQVIGPV